MYTLILEGLASKSELEEWYTLDEALTLYALHTMRTDMQRCQTEDEVKRAKEEGGRS